MVSVERRLHQRETNVVKLAVAIFLVKPSANDKEKESENESENESERATFGIMKKK